MCVCEPLWNNCARLNEVRTSDLLLFVKYVYCIVDCIQTVLAMLRYVPCVHGLPQLLITILIFCALSICNWTRHTHTNSHLDSCKPLLRLPQNVDMFCFFFFSFLSRFCLFGCCCCCFVLRFFSRIIYGFFLAEFTLSCIHKNQHTCLHRQHQNETNQPMNIHTNKTNVKQIIPFGCTIVCVWVCAGHQSAYTKFRRRREMEKCDRFIVVDIYIIMR